jgi:MFS family permease
MQPAQPVAIPQSPPPAAPPSNDDSGLGPLRIPLFRDRWIASTVSSVGTWMQDTAGTWLMTALTGSPLLIALMQTAASLPVFLLGLLAGATADIFDRRRLLIFWQVWMLVSVGVLTILTFAGWISPVMLLGLTFLLNVGSAMNNPAWQAIVPELVPHSEIPNAVTLNAASNNLARAVGPAIGGLIVAAFVKVTFGAGWVFALNSASFVGVVWVLWRWVRTPLFKSALPSERIASSMRVGLRYLRHAPQLQAALLRAFVFTFFVSAVWSLLAVVAKRAMPHRGAIGYGILNGAMGVGAVIAAVTLPRFRHRISSDRILMVATCVYVCVIAVLALVQAPWALIAVLLVGGMAWTSAMSTLNVSVQLSAPAWVQARSLGVYQMTFQGGLAIGSIVWGFVAEHAGLRPAMLAAAIGMAVTLPFAMRFHILRDQPDLTPYQWRRPVPQFAEQPEMEVGPVRVALEYRVPRENYAEFTHAIHEMRGVRLRDGAIRWAVFRDAADPEHITESFIMESWLDYLRSRERVTAEDYAVRDRVNALTLPGTQPVVTHQIYAREVSNPTPPRLKTVAAAEG